MVLVQRLKDASISKQEKKCYRKCLRTIKKYGLQAWLINPSFITKVEKIQI